MTEVLQAKIRFESYDFNIHLTCLKTKPKTEQKYCRSPHKNVDSIDLVHRTRSRILGTEADVYDTFINRSV